MEGVGAGTDGDAIASFGGERADAIPPPRTTPFEMASLLLTGSVAPWLHPETAVIETTAARVMILHMVVMCCGGTAFLARPSTST